jgi:hypothetical protein
VTALTIVGETHFLFRYHLASLSLITHLSLSHIPHFHYAALFGVMLPGAFLLLLVTYCIDVVGKAWRLLTLHQRLVPQEAENIGVWNVAMEFVAVASVLT